MSPLLRPAQKTPVTPSDCCDAISLLLPYMPAEGVGVLLAQYLFETANFKSCYNFNVGNVKVRISNGQATEPFFMHPGRVNEYIGGKLVEFRAPHPQTWFAAYEGLADAIEKKVKLIERKWPNALTAAARGDVAGFAQALQEGPAHYFTDGLEHYTQGLKDRYPSAMLHARGYDYLETIHHGDESATVQGIQNWLDILGYPCRDSGKFDKETLAAVRLYQQTNQLPVDGVVGAKTWGKLVEDMLHLDHG